MIAGARLSDKAFKRALTVSAAAHVLLFAFILINPALPKKATPKGVIHYVGISGIGGGGGGRPAGGPGGKAAAAVKTEAPAPAVKKETLRDLTTPDKVKPKVESKLRYPVADAKTKRKQAPEKKASISKPEPGAKTEGTAEKTNPAGLTGEGSSMLIGLGGEGEGTGTGEGGGGLGDGFGDGLANFPYAYYINRIRDEIQVNWFPSRIDPGPDVVLLTKVYFRIYRNGSISTVEIKRPSGIPDLDRIAVRAVTNAAPFPPLPNEYDDEYLGLNLYFEHKR